MEAVRRWCDAEHQTLYRRPNLVYSNVFFLWSIIQPKVHMIWDPNFSKLQLFCFWDSEAHLWRFLKAMSENAKSGVFFSQSNFRGYIICVTAKKIIKNCKLSSNYNCTFSHYCIVNTNGISTDFGGKSSVHHLQKCSAGP